MLNIQDVGGVHIKYLYHCPRQLWLYARGFRPEGGDDLVSFGTAVDVTTFQRKRPLDLGLARPDWVDGDGWIHDANRPAASSLAIGSRFACTACY